MLALLGAFPLINADWANAGSNDQGIKRLEETQAVIIDLADRVTPSVVNISSGDFPHSSRRPSERREDRSPSPPGSGSGVIIDKKGFIVTNNHVVGDANEVEVRLSDKTKFTGKVIGKDPDTDLAVIKIDSEKDLPFVPIGDSKNVKVGQWVMAVGNPFGLDRTVTIGIVSGLGRENVNLSRYEDFIQTDASINPGNSGGPLFNLHGEVIGINTAIINVAQGIGFAIPANMVQTIVSQLMSSGKVVRGWLGVGIQPLTEELAKKFGVKEGDGVLVNEVFEGNPAYEGGMQPGDIILKVDDQVVETPNSLARVIAGFIPGQKVRIELMRNGKKEQLTLALGEKKDGAITAALPKLPEPFLGLTVEMLTPEMMEKFDIKEEKAGVVVTDVKQGSPSESGGLKPGDLIKEIEGKAITNLDDFKMASEKVEKTGTVLFRVSRKDRAFFIVLNQPTE